MAGRNAGRILPLVTAISMTVGCASTGLGRSSAPEPTPRASRAGVVSGNWDLVEVLRPGTALVVTLKNGNLVEGGFKALHPMILALVHRDGKEWSIARSDIAAIIARSASDGLTNGALTGAGIGLAAAVAILSVAGSGDGYLLPSATWGAPLLLSGVGGVLGAVIDHARDNEKLVYRAGPD